MLLRGGRGLVAVDLLLLMMQACRYLVLRLSQFPSRMEVEDVSLLSRQVGGWHHTPSSATATGSSPTLTDANGVRSLPIAKISSRESGVLTANSL